MQIICCISIFQQFTRTYGNRITDQSSVLYLHPTPPQRQRVPILSVRILELILTVKTTVPDSRVRDTLSSGVIHIFSSSSRD